MESQIWNYYYRNQNSMGKSNELAKSSRNKNITDYANSSGSKDGSSIVIMNGREVEKNKFKALKVNKSSELRVKMNERDLSMGNLSKLSEDGTAMTTSITKTNDGASGFDTSNRRHSINDDSHFIDHEFPPNKKSIENRNKRNSFSFLNLIHSVGMKRAKCWLRPNELKIPDEESLLPISLYSGSSSKDVLQGGIGSCWFISALSVIAERPELLSNILVTKSYNANGLHTIRLCKRGEWVTINIDDYLPCDKKGKVIFAYARYRQLWVSFIEKALAKLYGGYKAIVSGACVEGLQTLTGEPCEIIYLDNAQRNLNDQFYDYKTNLNHHDNPWNLWTKLLYANNSGYLMTTLCYKDDLRFFDMQRVGLFKRHIYSVLDVREFSNNGQIINLVKLSK